MTWLEPLFNLILTGGIAAAVALWLFKQLGEKWLSAQFDKRLEHLRHQQSQELEQLRFRIAKMMDKATKLSQREFEVLPDAWAKLVDAYHGVAAHVSSIRQVPALGRMNDAQLEEFLVSSELTETQKAELRASSDRERTYHKLIYWHDKHRATQKARELSLYLAKYGIFIREKQRFSQIEKMIWDALLEHQLHIEDEIVGREKRAQLDREGKAAMDALETEIHGTLWTLVDDKG